MDWFKKATSQNFEKVVKNILKSHPFTMEIAKYYHIPLEDIDNNLEIEICKLDGEFARGNGKVIRIDKKLLNKDFFNENFHFVIHEFFHWLKRRSEQLFYFNDPEEVQSFVLQIVWLLISGKDLKTINNEIYPIIQNHFKNDSKSRLLYNEMLEKATNLFNIYKKSK